jgi:hypothetical protein
VAACAALVGTPALAQTAVTPGSDPLAPQLQTDPRQPPRFEKSKWRERAPLSAPATFKPVPPAAGDTGFDATNTRPAGTQAQPRAALTGQSGALAPGLLDAQPAPSAIAQADDQSEPAAEPVSPYQTPPPSLTGGPPFDIGPIRKLPKKLKAHEEIEDPYAPLGVHAGAFTVYPAVEFIGGYDTNPSRSSGGKGAALYSIAPELQAQSNWSRHELKVDLRGSYTGYSPDETPTLSRPSFDGKITGRVDVTRDTRVDLNTRALVSTDNPGSPNIQAGLSKLPIFFTYGGGAGIAHSFNRFELAVKGTAERTVYQDSELTDGTTASNKDRQYNLYGAAVRGSYELFPGVKPYVEVAGDTRIHDLATDVYGFQRDSKGLSGSVGSTLQLTRVLTGEISVGYVQRKYDDPRFDDLTGLIGNASLIWTVDALNTVKFTASSTVGETTVPDVSGVLYRDALVQLDHSFRRWLIGTVKLGVGLDDYKNSPSATFPEREDKRYSAAAGLTYKLNRSLQLKGEVQQYWLRSNVAGNDYQATVFLLGLRAQR